MKIFALYIKIQLIDKPTWFGEFIEKYFEPVTLHVTLIQPRYVDEEQVQALQSLVREAVKKFSTFGYDKKVVFDSLDVEKESDEKFTFMLGTRNNDFINNLQKELRISLEKYDTFVDEAHKEYEINFRPHITIAIDLDEKTKEEALQYFATPYKLEGIIEELVLPVVKDQSIEERTDTKNQNIFKL
jgi:2'-5' RNA ligase